MKITINGEVYNNLSELHINRELRRTEIRYNTQGDMLIDLVARKYALKVTFGLLSEYELKKLRMLSEKIFVTATFTTPEGEFTGEFHISDEPAAEVKMINGVRMYGGVKMSLKQK